MMSGAIGGFVGMMAAGAVGAALETLGDHLESRKRGRNYYPCARPFYDDDDDDDDEWDEDDEDDEDDDEWDDDDDDDDWY